MRVLLRSRLPWLACAIFLTGSATARAAEKPAADGPEVKTSIRWVNEKGSVFKRGWKGKQSRLIWKETGIPPKEGPPRVPSLRTWVKIPARYRIQKIIETSGPSTLEAEGAPWPAGGGQILRIDGYGPIQHVSVRLRAKGRVREFGLISQLMESVPLHTMDPECGATEFEWRRLEAGGAHPFGAFSCVDHGDVVDLYLFHSPSHPVQVRLAGIRTEGVTDGVPWVRFRARRPRKPLLSRRRIGAVRFRNPNNEDFTQFDIIYTPRTDPRRFRAGSRLSWTLLRYSEDAGSVGFNEVALTAQGHLGYKLWPDVLDVDLSGYINLLPVYHSASDVPAARFFGINTRLGYRLPMSLGSWEWSFLGGLYVWSMIVPGGNYGLSYLAGPQVFIQARDHQEGHRAFAFYVKFAPIGESTGEFSLRNREIAAGGSYQINSPAAARPLSLTLDLSHARYFSIEQNNGMKLATVSLGLQMEF